MTPTGPEMYRSPADIAKAEKEAIALREAQEREKAGIQVAGGMVFQKPPGGTLQRVIQPPAPEVVAKEQRTVLSQQVKDLRQEFEKAGYPDPNSFLAATVQIPAGAGKTYEEAKEISFKVPVKNRGLVKQILPKADFEKWKQKAAELQGLEQQLSGAREAVLGQAAAPAVTAGITADIVQRGKSTKPEFPVAPSAAAPAVAAVAAAGVAPNREAAQSGQRYIDPEGKIRIKP
jgi:hypothetical protein